MKKKTRRHIKKISKTLRRAWDQVAPTLEKQGLLVGGGLGGTALMVAAARDPEVRRSAQALAVALRDFVTRSALGGQASAEQKVAEGRPGDAHAGDDDDDDAHAVGHTH